MATSKGAKACCASVIFLVSIILWGLSFTTLSPLECGLKINKVTAQVDESRIYTSGRYFVGVQHSFVRYPTTLLTIEFSKQSGADAPPLRAASKEGLLMELEVSFQFRLKINYIKDLYRRYEQNYKAKFLTIAETKLKEIVGQRYTSTDYYEQRRGISQVLHGALNKRFQEDFAVVENFQLRNIGVPVETDLRIQQKLEAKERANMAEVQAMAAIERSSIQVVRDGATAFARIKTAEAGKMAKIIVAEAQANAVYVKQAANAKAYAHLKTTLNFTNPELLRFLYYEQVRQLDPSAGLAIDVDAALFRMTS